MCLCSVPYPVSNFRNCDLQSSRYILFIMIRRQRCWQRRIHDISYVYISYSSKHLIFCFLAHYLNFIGQQWITAQQICY